jgi:hypothetical protein
MSGLDTCEVALGRLAPPSITEATSIICRSLDLKFQQLARDIAPCHSSRGGEFGGRTYPVKYAEHWTTRSLTNEASIYASVG